MPPTDADLARLTEAERQLLRLLVEGHTAKSIATQLECSVGSVNERLREARRKTGTGSSRELARLLRDQENRDEEIGVAGDGAVRASPSVSAADDWQWWGVKGAFMAFALTAVAAVALIVLKAAQEPVPSANSAPIELVAEPAIYTGPSIQDTRATLFSEGRDEPWAAKVESELRAQYSAIEGMGSDPALRVKCGRTLCEVAGVERVGLSSEQSRKFSLDLQAGRRSADAGLGLKPRHFAITSLKSDRSRAVFVTYLTRDAKPELPPSDPLIEAALPPGPNFRELQDAIARQQRDEPWAKQTEQALTALYSSLPHVAPRSSLRATCGAARCMIAGLSQPGLDGPQKTTYMAGLQSNEAREKAMAIGLEPDQASFGMNRKDPKLPLSFLLFFNRKAAAAPN